MLSLNESLSLARVLETKHTLIVALAFLKQAIAAYFFYDGSLITHRIELRYKDN
jgi:hypothetical protein